MDARFFIPDAIRPVRSWTEAGTAPPTGAARATMATRPLHDPPLEPRDEAVFLLTAAAEVEHALMVQYLYAAYSVRVEGSHAGALRRVQGLLTQIAREEMAHLATVQNLLRLVGGPLHLDREHSAQAGSIAPFRFRLEPVSLLSLAKYVIAESPEQPPPDMSADDRELVDRLRADAEQANDGREVRHVGPIFERLATLFADDVHGLSDGDLRLDHVTRQATFRDWGFDPERPTEGEPLIIESFAGDASSVRAAAHTAVQKIGLQGEGFDVDPGTTGSESHFERFLAIYREVSALAAAGATVTWPVATDPNTSPPQDDADAATASAAAANRITAPRARAWAQLFDLRYRLLLGQFLHFLSVDGDLYSATDGPQLGDRTARGLLLVGTFDEMRRLKKIAGKLVQLPKDDPAGALHAGPPFELPYTLGLPDGEPARWRLHLEVSRASIRLVRDRLGGEQDDFLTDLLERWEVDQQLMHSLAQGQPIPEDRLPGGFSKAVTILEEAVRGFTIGRHGNFWADRSRDEFLAAEVFGQTPVQLGPGGSVVPDPDEAPLVQRLEAPPGDRMPRFRPPVPAPRLAYIRQWIAGGCPDDDPAGHVGTRHERDPAAEPIATPPPGPQPGFAADIAGLFRPLDRASMLFRFDLHRYEDVRDHAAAILTRLEDGSMPCDRPWAADRISLFRQWISGGTPP